MEKFAEYATATMIMSALAYFLWWKKQLHSEIVKPDVDKINSRIDFLESRTVKLEDLYDRISENIEKKIDSLQATVMALSKEVAQLNGQLQMMRKGK